MTRFDVLEKMMLLQQEFQEKLGYDFTRMTSETQYATAYVKDMSLYLMAELQEMLYELPYFKSWKDYSGMSQEQREAQILKAKEEWIDALHFFLNIGLALGLDYRDVFTLYKIKNSENIARQENGYSFTEKKGEANE